MTSTKTQEVETKLAFEEYELYYKSTEKVTEWRLTLNRWNYSICTALLVSFAVLLNWASSRPGFLGIALLGITLLCILGMLFSALWVGQIKAYKLLNDAKYEVLNSMAPHILFGPSSCDVRVSCSPFEKEWLLLKQKEETLEKLSGTQTLTLRPSNIEYLIPKAFGVLFGLILIVAVGLAMANWGLIVNAGPFTVQLTPTATPVAIPTP